jgi:hypothetical protein
MSWSRQRERGTRMRRKRSAGVPAAVVAAVLLAGCANGDAEAVSADSEAPQPAEATSSVLAVVQDGDTCKGFSDVMTIVENAEIGVREGRMAPQEQQGWYGLATRVLDRLPSGEGGAVGLAIADLQEVAPAVALGAGTEVAGIGSAEWHSAVEALGDACRDAGAELTIGVFTGG